MPWSAAEKQEFITESQTVFALNAAIFDAFLERDRPQAAAAFLAAERAHQPR